MASQPQNSGKLIGIKDWTIVKCLFLFVGVQVWHAGASVHLLVFVRCYLTSWSIVSSRWYCKSSCSSSGSSRKPSRFRRKWVERNRKSLWSLQCLMIWSTTGWCVCVWLPIRCLPIRVIHFSSSLAFCARWVCVCAKQMEHKDVNERKLA